MNELAVFQASKLWRSLRYKRLFLGCGVPMRVAQGTPMPWAGHAARAMTSDDPRARWSDRHDATSADTSAMATALKTSKAVRLLTARSGSGASNSGAMRAGTPAPMTRADQGMRFAAAPMPAARQTDATAMLPNKIVAPLGDVKWGDRRSIGKCPLTVNPYKDRTRASAAKSAADIQLAIDTVRPSCRNRRSRPLTSQNLCH